LDRSLILSPASMNMPLPWCPRIFNNRVIPGLDDLQSKKEKKKAGSQALLITFIFQTETAGQ